MNVRALGDLLSPGNLLAGILHLFVVVHPRHVESGNILAPVLVHSTPQEIVLEFISHVLSDELSQACPLSSLPI